MNLVTASKDPNLEVTDVIKTTHLPLAGFFTSSPGGSSYVDSIFSNYQKQTAYFSLLLLAVL
jgi:hypothetical protein